MLDSKGGVEMHTSGEPVLIGTPGSTSLSSAGTMTMHAAASLSMVTNTLTLSAQSVTVEPVTDFTIRYDWAGVGLGGYNFFPLAKGVFTPTSAITGETSISFTGPSGPWAGGIFSRSALPAAAYSTPTLSQGLSYYGWKESFVFGSSFMTTGVDDDVAIVISWRRAPTVSLDMGSQGYGPVTLAASSGPPGSVKVQTMPSETQVSFDAQGVPTGSGPYACNVMSPGGHGCPYQFQFFIVR